jgi:hypothetical protein
MSRSKNKIKPRLQRIYSTTKKGITEISLSFDPQNGAILFDTEMTNIYSETTFDRPKGQKVVSRVPILGGAHFKIDDAIEKNFDIVFAIDTNTRNIRGYSISISGVIQCQKVFAVDSMGMAKKYWQWFTPFCMEFLEVKSKPENLGWMMLIDYITSPLRDFFKKRIGIIVDSDLGKLNQYNLRKSPIYEEVLLPKNIQLIYASSDVGRDLFPNQMLKLADRASARCLNALESGHIPFNSERIEGAPYLGYRRLLSKNAMLS